MAGASQISWAYARLKHGSQYCCRSYLISAGNESGQRLTLLAQLTSCCCLHGHKAMFYGMVNAMGTLVRKGTAAGDAAL